MESNTSFELERPSQYMEYPSYLSKYTYEFTQQEYYLYNGVTNDVFNCFINKMNKVSKGELSKTSIIIFLNYLWGYLTLEDLTLSFKISKNDFLAIFHTILDYWSRSRETECLPGIKNNGILNMKNCSRVVLINLFLPIDDDKDLIRNNSLFFSEQYNQNGIKIQLTIMDDVLVSVDGFHFGSQDDLECAGVEEIPKNVAFQEIDLLFNENEIERKLAHYKFYTLTGEKVRDILVHVSRFSIFNKRYRNDPDDFMHLFEIIFYLSKLFITSSLD